MVAHARRVGGAAQGLFPVTRADQQNVFAVLRHHIGAVDELAVRIAVVGGGRAAAQGGDLGDGPARRCQAADGDAVNVAAQVGGIGVDGLAVGVLDDGDFTDHATVGAELGELVAGVGIKDKNPVAFGGGADGTVGIGVFTVGGKRTLNFTRHR